MSFYTLTIDPRLVVGARLADYAAEDAPLVTRDPRTLHPTEIADLDHLEPEDLILGQAQVTLRIAQVVPEGPVTPMPGGDLDGNHGDGDPHYCYATGWTVQHITGLEPLLGPNAAHIVRATKRAAELNDENAIAVRYADALEGVDFSALRSAQYAAEEALCGRGVDAFWLEHVGGCTSEGIIAALAARDLINTAPEWTQAAYDLITASWHTAFGVPIHPDDT